jgi:ABC-2 type transport system ATP-binding protein
VTTELTAGRLVEIVPENLTLTLHRVSGWAIERGLALEDLQIIRPSLEDVYLELTGGQRDTVSTVELGR